jgi:hypothetical protein
MATHPNSKAFSKMSPYIEIAIKMALIDIKVIDSPIGLQNPTKKYLHVLDEVHCFIYVSHYGFPSKWKGHHNREINTL